MDNIFIANMRAFSDFLSPWFMLFGSALAIAYGAIWRIYHKRLVLVEKVQAEEKKARETATKEMCEYLAERERSSNKHCEDCKEKLLLVVKEANEEMVDEFKEGIKKEREFRIDVMKELKANDTELFKIMKEVCETVVAIKTTQDIYIKIEENK